jgi:predicted phosphodiesterase
MRIHLLSDLHLEFAPFSMPEVEADVTIVAGDLHTGTNGLKWLAKTVQSRPVIYVPGNHEFYGHTLQKLLRELQELKAGSNLHYLHNSAVTISDVTFLGTTLWTDFALNGNPAVSAIDVQLGMADYRRIRTEPTYSRLKASDTLGLHMESRAWLAEQFRQQRAEKLVVVTHHAPSALSVPPQYKGDSLSPGYASNLDELVETSGARFWFHGHIHEAVDYMIGKTRVISNPRGYPDEKNTGFKPGLILELK